MGEPRTLGGGERPLNLSGLKDVWGAGGVLLMMKARVNPSLSRRAVHNGGAAFFRDVLSDVVTVFRIAWDLGGSWVVVAKRFGWKLACQGRRLHPRTLALLSWVPP